jgi:hypothetical protein
VQRCLRSGLCWLVSPVWPAGAHSIVEQAKRGHGAQLGRFLPGDARGAYLTEQEKTAHRVARQLSINHRIDDRLYRNAEKLLGAAGIAEITVLTGTYHSVCPLFNIFDIPAP